MWRGCGDIAGFQATLPYLLMFMFMFTSALQAPKPKPGTNLARRIGPFAA